METILLIERDDNQRLLYEKALIDEGYKVIPTKTARESLLVLRTNTPDVVVLDIMVPDMDGSELLGRLIAVEKKVPIIIHTAYKGFSYRFMSSAAEAFVLKSTDLTELKNRIRENIKMAHLKYNYVNN
ncbi:MAG TPA: response regulator [Candidatus Brocadiia bacterium]|nr:response regulator [Candidatus Brocadiales bacterium]